jgi:hypothetical protein
MSIYKAAFFDAVVFGAKIRHLFFVLYRIHLF